MPELVDLEAIREVLESEVVGMRIERVTITHPIIVRCRSHDAFAARVTGQQIRRIGRRGKFLLIELSDGTQIVVNPMLAGRLQLCPASTRVRKSTSLRLSLEDGRELRYFDDRQMGKIYLAEKGDFSEIPQFSELGPDALSQALTEVEFVARLRRFRAPIKQVLTNQRCIAGIGNAYADEILHEAGISPLRRRARLTKDELGRLYAAMKKVLGASLAQIRTRLGRDIHVEHREFLAVHRPDAADCPRCGHPLTSIRARSRLTVFCRRCQP